MLLGPVGFDSAQIAAAIQRYDEALGRHLTAIIGQYPVEACPGGPELVEALHVRPGVVLGILTGNVPSTASIKLRTVGYDLDRFAVGAYGSEAPVRAGLPPIALSRAEKHYGQPFARVVIIGDTPDDVSCARSIGARTIAVTSGYGKRAEIEAEGPDVLLPDLRDTALVLDAIFSGAV
jgi:phosphoglycolate phosphatase-like HAD superfamily hydrolase